jgi:hypothetical protein
MTQKIQHLSGGNVHFEPNKKIGYYLIDNNIYYTKIQAFLAASKMPTETWNLNNDRIKWVFNDDVFIKYPWHIEPEPTLRELYCKRAQQLRDQYDYLRLEFSGGSDSVTVAFSFLMNGIHLDEIVFRYPKKGEKNVSGNPWDTSSENTLSEWEFSAKPILDWISTHFPKTKIIVHDYSEDMLAQEKTLDESWIFKTRHYLQPGHAHKHANTGALSDIFDQNKTVAVIWGVDKPKLCIKDEKFFLYFVDGLASVNNPDISQYTNITNEFFFWTPDCPELIAKQAHTLMKWYKMPGHHKFQHVLHWPNNHFANRQLSEHLARSVIYPDWDSNTFQVVKPSNNIYNEMDFWFHTNFKDTRLNQVWRAGVDYLLDNIDSKYIGQSKNRPANIKEYMTPFYYLGDSIIPDIGVFNTRELVKNFRNDQNKYIHCIRGRLSVY